MMKDKINHSCHDINTFLVGGGWPSSQQFDQVGDEMNPIYL